MPASMWTLGALLLFAVMGYPTLPGYQVEGVNFNGKDTSLVERVIPVQLGETEVSIVVHQAEAPGHTYLNLHDDENTAVKAALETIRRDGGRLVEVRHGGERNVSFTLDGQVYTFDPNRIFTDKGAAATLKNLGSYSKTAWTATRRFAQTLLHQLDLETTDVIVTVHNNTEGRYSARSYTHGERYEQEARAVHLAAGADADDFFFTTNSTIYKHMLDGGVNLVLQDNQSMTDDGSLSVYSGLHGISYINVEAQHNHLEAQADMMRYLVDVLAESAY